MRPKTANSENRSKAVKRVVNLTLRPDVDPVIADKIVAKCMGFIKMQEWRFNFTEYDEKDARKVFEIASIALTKKLELHFCKHSQIIKEISPVSFPRLTSLSLNGNKIVSLEGLYKCELPSLQELWLRENYITSLRLLRKFRFKLKRLDVTQNKIINFDNIWGSMDLTTLQDFNFHNNPTQINWSFVKAHTDPKKIERNINDIRDRFWWRKVNFMKINLRYMRINLVQTLKF